MSPSHSTRSANAVALWIVAVVALLFFLRAARTLLIPVALAVLISYALAPVVSWLGRRSVPRIAGASLVMLAILGAAAAGAYTLRNDARYLIATLPEKVERVREKVLEELGSGGKVIEQAAKESTTGGGATGAGPGEGPTETTGPTTGSLVQRAVAAVFSLAGDLVVIFFLIYFLLISAPQTRNRLVEISGPDAARRRMTSTIIDDINTQIQRYLLVLVVTGALVGTATWLVLAWMGMQQAALWGIAAGVFNSIPYFGPVVVSGGLFLVGLTQGGGMTQALQAAGAALVITSLEGWVLTPALMGKAERMSALAVFLGLLLWTWVWGAWGTVLAVPMLVVIKSVADHVPTLRPLGRLMAP